MSAKPVATVPDILAAVACISSAALAYEILLTRLFAIIQWHHFAFMVISIALLGFGASGALLAVWGRMLCRRFHAAFAANALLFAFSSVFAFLFAQRLEFNPLELAWGLQQAGKLLAIYLLLLVPFLFAANAIGLALMAYAEQAARVYAWDLAGAGAGAVAIVGVLFVLPPEAALFCPAALGGIAGVVSLVRRRAAGLIAAAAVAGLAAVTFALLPADLKRLRMSEFKAASQHLNVAGATLAAELDSPLARLSIIENREIPMRHAPGLSLRATTPVPAQAGIYIDGDGPSAITQFDGKRESIAFVDDMTSALPYQLVETPAVLVLGAGGGADVLQAIYHRAKQVDVVELNPQIVKLVGDRYAAFSGRLFERPEVHVVLDDARGYARKTRARYDIVQLALSESQVASGSGLHALAASRIYTVEGMSDFLRLLRPGGFLCITRWVKLPPRDSAKLFATAVAALESRGESEPARRLAWIRNWNTSTLVVKNGAWTGEDASRLRAFASARAFDAVYYPGMPAAEANRFNQLKRPWFHEAAQNIVSDHRQRYLDRYKFDIRPATDDRPYFHNFFKLAHAGEILALSGRGGMGLVDLGYLVVWATLVKVLALSIIFILLPLWVFYLRGERRGPDAGATAGVIVYFLCIGFGFIFIEIIFIQKLLLFLHHPLYAVAVVLAGFLVFAGFGSRVALVHAGRPVLVRILVPVAAIVLLGWFYLDALPKAVAALAPLPDPLRILAALGLIAPLAFFMGMPFPVAIESLSAHRDSLVPLAWGANGCASVTGAVLAALVAVSYGGSAGIVIAFLFYACAALFGLPALRRLSANT